MGIVRHAVASDKNAVSGDTPSLLSSPVVGLIYRSIRVWLPMS